jgi:hypothetical protein
MDQAGQIVQNNKGMIGSVAFLAVLLVILYVVYTYLYPADDPTYTQFLKGEADARHSVTTRGKVPAIYTGGDFTFSFWIYVDDWNYRASANKFLFAISPDPTTPTSVSPLVALLTPIKNGLMIRASSVRGSSVPAPGSAPSNPGAGGPDITIESNLQALLAQQTSMTMFQDSVEQPCDIKDVPLQRWVNITIVNSGRVLDVYIDGKLQRSCVLDNVLNVPRGPLKLRLAENGGFGGRYSSIQMWNQQLTPDVIYGIYQMGPTQASHDIFTTIAKWFNLNVSFTGSAPGQPISMSTPANPLTALYREAGAAAGGALQSVESGASTAGAYVQSVF